MVPNARCRGIVVSFLLVMCFLCPSARADGFQSAWTAACSGAGLAEIPAVTRTPVAGDVVEYSAELRVGPGEFDRIGIHRVVRELGPWRPKAAPRGALLVHGSASTFRTAFAPGLVRPDLLPRDFGLAPFLAEAGIDVWGIDLRWTKVPLEQTTFEFMRSWNFASHVKDVRVVAKIARLVRALTGADGARRSVAPRPGLHQPAGGDGDLLAHPPLLRSPAGVHAGLPFPGRHVRPRHRRSDGAAVRRPHRHARAGPLVPALPGVDRRRRGGRADLGRRRRAV